MRNPRSRAVWVAIAGLATAVTAALVVSAATPPDTLDVKFTEWQTPSQPPYPHDPEVAPDGSVWYTAQRASTLGRLDPKTGAFKEYPLPTPNSGPHGLVADTTGNIWYTGNAVGVIGKLDPKTGKVTEYKMPDPRARDPHTPIFDARGILWFTVQGGNFVGTLDPKTGKVTLVAPPTPNARPYGIKINSKGVPFFDLFNTNKIGSIDPATMKITEYPLPDPNARPRRIAIGHDDTVYYTDYARGYLGRLDPKTGKVEEFASPGGADSRPYGIATAPDGTIWYCETGDDAKNMLVRFAPATKALRAWPIPGGGGTVRHMVASPSGELWLAESGVGKIARVQIRIAPSEE
jgi:virginiamycin B lyase